MVYSLMTISRSSFSGADSSIQGGGGVVVVVVVGGGGGSGGGGGGENEDRDMVMRL